MIEKLTNIIEMLIKIDTEVMAVMFKKNNMNGYYYYDGIITAREQILNYIKDLKEEELDNMYMQYKKENNINE